MVDIPALEAGRIDPAEFDHVAHVYIAWKYLQQTGLAEAIARFTAALRQLTARAGANEIPRKHSLATSPKTNPRSSRHG